MSIETGRPRYCNQSGHIWTGRRCVHCNAERAKEERKGGSAVERAKEMAPHPQNIPIRTELGAEIRRAFIAEQDCTCNISVGYTPERCPRHDIEPTGGER